MPHFDGGVVTMPNTLRSAIILAASAMLCVSGGVRAQIPPSVELRVPKAPTVARADAGAFLAYELHVTNLTPNVFTITGVDVLRGPVGDTVLYTLADSALTRDMNRPGPTMAAAKRPTIEGGMRGIVYLWVPLTGASAPAAVRHRVTLQQDTVGHELVTTPVPVHAAASLIGPPLRGEWIAVNGPSNVSGHRRLVLALNGNVASGQRFGIDFIAMADHGTLGAGDGSANEDYHGHGADVLAVADGVVVETKDGIPENTGGPQSRAVTIDLHTVSGNSVVIDIGDGRHAFYAHLIPGSLLVREGDRVRRGQVIGRVGNSGNSTAPHLHFHVVDGLAAGTSTLGAEGIPYAIGEFEVLGRCTAFDGSGCPRSEPVAVRGGIPLQNQIVRFRD
jgi:murein DD-endopeptidase